jgi:hypothetical protein
MPSPYGPKKLVVPNDTDPPDSPADWRRFVDSMPHRISVAYSDNTNYDEIAPRPGNAYIIHNLTLNTQPGSLIFAHGAATMFTWNAAIIAYFSLRVGGVIISRQTVDGSPNGMRVDLSNMAVAVGSTTLVELLCELAVGGRYGLQYRHIDASSFVT